MLDEIAIYEQAVEHLTNLIKIKTKLDLQIELAEQKVMSMFVPSQDKTYSEWSRINAVFTVIQANKINGITSRNLVHVLKGRFRGKDIMLDSVHQIVCRLHRDGKIKRNDGRWYPVSPS